MKKTILLTMTILCVGFATACNLYDTDKANKLVDEANIAIREANDNIDKGGNKLTDLDNAIPRVRSENDLERLRAVAKEIIPTIEKARDKFKEAGGKFEQASKLNLQDKFKEYLNAKANE